jgi:hypothetical protein
MFSTHLPLDAETSETPWERSEIPTQWDKPREIAELFLKKLAGRSIQKLIHIKITYDVHMDLEGFVKATMVATLELKKEKDNYLSIFSLKKPVGKNLWSRFALFVYGRHTDEYREMIKTIETRIHERFRYQNGRFITGEFREVLPNVKVYDNQTSIRVYFDYRKDLVKFWEDQTKETFSRSIPYSNQVGPLTAFFNYLLFEPTSVEISIINAMKQVEDISSTGDSLPDRKTINFLFESQVVRLQGNNTGNHTEYSLAIYFEGKNYLDIIYGENIFFELSRATMGKAKVPYAIHLDGIISKSKKGRLERRLRQLMDNPEGALELGEESEEETLAAKNVKIYLTDADVGFEGF